jgi:hypothetical protein
MATLANITFACQDPSRLADFWAAALGYVKQEAATNRPSVGAELRPRGMPPYPRGELEL